MALRSPVDFRIEFKGGGEFSSQQEGFIVVESLKLAKKHELNPSLQLHRHCKFIGDVLERQNGRCFWFVETPSSKALPMLQKHFPNHQLLNGSIAGYFEHNPALVSEFWNTFAENYEAEPWKNEQAWALASVTETMPEPQSQSWMQKPFWSVEHALQNCEKFQSLFVQSGWFGFFAVRPFQNFNESLTREFPNLEIPLRR